MEQVPCSRSVLKDVESIRAITPEMHTLGSGSFCIRNFTAGIEIPPVDSAHGVVGGMRLLLSSLPEFPPLALSSRNGIARCRRQCSTLHGRPFSHCFRGSEPLQGRNRLREALLLFE